MIVDKIEDRSMKKPNSDIARILIAGDTCPTGANEELFEVGSTSDILGDTAKVVEKSDLFVLNLECPFSDRTAPSLKIGPSLKASPTSAAGLATMGVDIVGIANNHMMDFGAEGLVSTIDRLTDHGIKVVGGGANLKEAWQIAAREVNGIRIGVVAVAESEFGIAGTASPGVCPFDLYDFHSVMQVERARFDHIVVLVHGGNEHHPYPRPGLLKSARFLASLGASAVICQHSHIIGCYEWYEGTPIVYGQGNFIFDYPTDRPTWSEGVLVQLNFTKTECTGIDFFPTTQGSRTSSVALLHGSQRRRILEDLEKRSKVLVNPEELERQWAEFCRSVERFYLNSLHGRAGIVRRIAGRLGYLKYLESKQKSRARLNLIRCESHREVLVSILTDIQAK